MLKLKPVITLYFARHGETLANVERRFQGRNDTPLTEHGRLQARMLAAILAELLATADAAIRLKSLPRARKTMELVLEALGLPRDYDTDPRLMEIDLGDWSGLTDDEAQTRRSKTCVYSPVLNVRSLAAARTMPWSPTG